MNKLVLITSSSLRHLYFAEKLNQQFKEKIIKIYVEITNDLIYCVVKNFENSKQSVEIYDFDDMDSKVANVISVGKSIKIQNKMGKDILRMSVHWKNICQGGSTPCFNGFVGNAYG